MNITDTTYPLLAHAKAAVLILEAAAAEGLPEPYIVRADRRVVEVQHSTVEDVAAWAEWLGTTVKDYSTGTYQHAETAKDLYDVPLTVCAAVRIRAA